MESKMFAGTGLGQMDPGFILIALIAVVVILLIVIVLLIVEMNKVRQLNQRVTRLCAGRKARSLEEQLDQIMEDNQTIMSTVIEHKMKINNIYKRLEKTYQKMSLIKYDAFSQMGGQLSFVLCMLDENDNGFLLNSVHSSEGCYSYTKEIVEGQCKINLGDEEELALEEAKAATLMML